ARPQGARTEDAGGSSARRWKRRLPDPEAVARDLPLPLEQRTRRRAARDGAVRVIHTAVAGAQEDFGGCLPVHGAAEMRAVDVEHLEHQRAAVLAAPDPTRGARGLGRPRA